MKRALTIMVALLVCAAPAFAQKIKVKNKEKRFETVVKPAAAYAGRYTGFDAEHYIEVSVDAAGNLSVTSVEGARRARLQDIKLENGRVTATKVYEDGGAQAFAATFANRILNGTSIFGLIVEGPVTVAPTVKINQVFYKRG